MTEGKLTPKQQMFVQEYLVDLNATQAAIRAGYSENSAEIIGFENLRKPNVAAEIQKAMKKRSERTEITQDYVLETIVDTVERCKQGERVKLPNGDWATEETENGEIYAVYAYDAKNVLKGCELLGKHLKLFTDKVELGGNVVLDRKVKRFDGRTDD